MRRQSTTYGQKGGEGPTRGKKATTYVVTLPDGSTAKKRDFNPPVTPTPTSMVASGMLRPSRSRTTLDYRTCNNARRRHSRAHELGDRMV